MKLGLILVILISVLAIIFAVNEAPDGYEVSQVHIAQGKSPSEMTISWVTSSMAASQVKYGLSPNDLPLIADGETSSYVFDAPGYSYYQSGTLHTVFLKNLKPNTKYFYQCGDINASSFSGVISFDTLPEVGSKLPLVFGLVGDLGETSDSLKTLEHMSMHTKMDMILHVGDLSYANCNQALWDKYGLMVEELSSQTPWMVGAGNHEIEYYDVKDGSKVYTAFEKRFRMPSDKPAEFGPITYSYNYVSCTPSEFQSEYNYGNSFFSFDSGMVHVINLNPYSTSSASSVQYQWLEKDLASVDRNITPWVIVMMHCPFYNSNKAHHDEYQTVQMKNSMEEMLYKNHVNVIFAGHVHAYERSFPIFRNDTKSDGITYINIGDGGNAEGHANTYYPAPSWSAFRDGLQYGHGELAVLNQTHMRWTWNRNADGVRVSMDTIFICNSAFGSSNC